MAVGSDPHPLPRGEGSEGDRTAPPPPPPAKSLALFPGAHSPRRNHVDHPNNAVKGGERAGNLEAGSSFFSSDRPPYRVLF